MHEAPTGSDGGKRSAACHLKSQGIAQQGVVEEVGQQHEVAVGWKSKQWPGLAELEGVGMFGLAKGGVAASADVCGQGVGADDEGGWLPMAVVGEGVGTDKTHVRHRFPAA